MCTAAPVLASAIATLAPAPPGRPAASVAWTNAPLRGRQGTRSTRSHAIGPITQKSAIGRAPHLTQPAGQPFQLGSVRQDDVIKPADRRIGSPAAEDASGDRRDGVGVPAPAERIPYRPFR